MTTHHHQWLEDFLTRLKQGGWSPVFAAHGWPMTMDTIQTTLPIDRTLEGFNEFASAGTCAIHPGDPALSLLYHGLMHPGVNHESITWWPSLADIDVLENTIYALAWQADTAAAAKLSCLTPVVMAYEYRITRRTPHQQHADLIFSRTGVGRVGTHEPEYSPQRRCFNTNPDDNSGGTRVQPVRYGLFLCEALPLGDAITIQGRAHSGDDQRLFYKPLIKLFDGMEIAGKTIKVQFDAAHQNDKLQRMVTQGKLRIDQTFDTNKPPFLYHSQDDDFVEQETHPGNLVIWRKPQEMCRVAEQQGSVVTFRVPKESFLWLKKLLEKFNIRAYNNRGYTSLRVGQALLWAGVDYGLNYLLELFKSDKRVFLSRRQAGEFINIRHMLDDKGEISDLNFLPPGKFQAQLSEGGYSAVMYEDPIAEGYISARIAGLQQGHCRAKPAYSLMTAPDYMPRVGNIDIYHYEDLFVSGGPRALCEGRLPANLRLHYRGTGEPVFAADEQTVTAISAQARKQGTPSRGDQEYDNTHFLTDEASDVFAPGWDITYTRDSLLSPAYYHTTGLGSPFLEDAKLCAAANGMWPAASPDAARTFKRSVRTAFPLTDEELGLSPASPLAQSLALNAAGNTRGWDGEHGPFIEWRDDRYVANYAVIERSDYISNYEQNRMDFSKLRQISRDEADRRLQSLSRVYQLQADGTLLKDEKFWLLSFVKVPPRAEGKVFLNLPRELIDQTDLQNAFLHEEQGGYFYIFAQYSATDDAEKEPLIRATQPLEQLVFVVAVANKETKLIQHPLAQ